MLSSLSLNILYTTKQHLGNCKCFHPQVKAVPEFELQFVEFHFVELQLELELYFDRRSTGQFVLVLGPF
jgi:hypothetical protein